jgi:dTDP-4-amino-4,6-dideoxygalactose transaminase
MGREELAALERVIDSRHLFRYRTGGTTETDLLERELESYMGVRHALALSSGTAALISGLAAMGVGPGDEVIVPAYTFISTALAPLALGAIPVIAEIDTSLTIDPADIERKITDRTKAIVPVHMMGFPCDMTRIMAVASRYSALVLEDACQADGGRYRGKRLGTFGAAGAYSFNHYKIISAGEGGALVTGDRDLYERAMVFHDGGCVFFRDAPDPITTPVFAGLNFRISDLLSAVLRVQLKRLEGILDELRADKRDLRARLSASGAFNFNPVNDPGECALALAIRFESPRQVRAFLAELRRRGYTDASSPIDSDRHVYTSWTPIQTRRGAHHDLRNPYASASSAAERSPDACPRTLSILETTVYIPIDPERDERGREALAAMLTDAYKRSQSSARS